MVLLQSNGPDLGSNAPDFSLPATDGKTYALRDFDDAQVLVVMFICNHCPYVKAVIDRLIALGRDFQEQPVSLVAISSNDAENYPADSFENMKKWADELDFPFPYLYDESQEVARAFDAVCTPDFFVYDHARTLAYAGRLDDNWRDPARVTRQDLRLAITALLDGDRPDGEQRPSMGCSIKWKH